MNPFHFRLVFWLNRRFLILVALLSVPLVTLAQDTVRISNNFSPFGDHVWTADNIYLISGDIFLLFGSLTIEPGTRIIVEPTDSFYYTRTGLTISASAQLVARGTEERPIVFEGAFGYSDSKEEGGLDLHWKGISLRSTPYPTRPSVLRHVSIIGAGFHAGSEEGGALTLKDMSAMDTVEYIEVARSAGDGVRIHGGDVNLSHVVVLDVEDDAFEWNYGWQGNGTYWTAINYSGKPDMPYGSHLIEGLGHPDQQGRVANPSIYHATLIGSSCNETEVRTPENSSPAIYLGEQTRGTIANSLIAHHKGLGIEVEDFLGIFDARTEMENGLLTVKNNIWTPVESCVSGALEPGTFTSGEHGLIYPSKYTDDREALFLQKHLQENSNSSTASGLRANRRGACYYFDPRLCEEREQIIQYPLAIPDAGWIQQEVVDMEEPGAFPTGERLWLEHWSYFFNSFIYGRDNWPYYGYQTGDYGYVGLKSGDTLRIPCDDYAYFHRRMTGGIVQKPCTQFDLVFSAKRRGNKRRRPRRRGDPATLAFTQDWAYTSESSGCTLFDTLHFTLEVYDSVAPVIHIVTNEKGIPEAFVEDCDEAWITEHRIDTTVVKIERSMEITYFYAAEDFSGNRSTKSVSITQGPTWKAYYADVDGDGYGNPNERIFASEVPAGFVPNGLDCNDSHSGIPSDLPFGEDCFSFTDGSSCQMAQAATIRLSGKHRPPKTDFRVNSISIPFDLPEDCWGDPNYEDGWVQFTPTSRNGQRLLISGISDYPETAYRVSLYSGHCGKLTWENCYEILAEDQPLDIMDLIPGTTYYLRFQEVHNLPFGADLEIIDLGALPSNRFCASPKALSFSQSDCEKDTVQLFGDVGRPLWYSMDMPPVDSLVFEVQNVIKGRSAPHPFVQLFEAGSCVNPSPLSSITATQLDSNLTRLVIRDVTPGTPLLLAISPDRWSEMTVTMQYCSYGTIVSQNEVIGQVITAKLFPTIAKDRVWYELETKNATYLSGDILDMNGRLVRSFLSRQLINGGIQGTIEVTDLPSGMYLVRWMSDQGTRSQRLVVEK
jgi:hypothetical protein